MIQVIFFGGYLSTQTDISAWLSSAKAQEPSVTFQGFAFPKGVGADGNAGIRGFGKLKLLSLANNILDWSGYTIIVGHSSGCALANELAAMSVADMNGVHTELVALDGYVPNAALRKQMHTTCWSAKCGGTFSRNWNAMSGTENFHFIESPNCVNAPWALHFSLVNSNATESNVRRITQGYSNCKANLMWLEEFINRQNI
jgi:hypothetical protein